MNKKLLIFNEKNILFVISRSLIDIKPEIAEALNSNGPVVALESTIITHGMPYPHNLETAIEVEKTVRNQVG